MTPLEGLAGSVRPLLREIRDAERGRAGWRLCRAARMRETPAASIPVWGKRSSEGLGQSPWSRAVPSHLSGELLLAENLSLLWGMGLCSSHSALSRFCSSCHATSTGASLVLHQSTGNSACTLGEQLLKGLSEITNKGCECSRVGRGSLTSLPCVRAGSSRGSGEKGPLSPLPPLGMCLRHGGLTPLRVTADNQKQTTSPTHPQKPAHGHEALRSPHWCV